VYLYYFSLKFFFAVSMVAGGVLGKEGGGKVGMGWDGMGWDEMGHMGCNL
jgi:hypothetical protein